MNGYDPQTIALVVFHLGSALVALVLELAFHWLKPAPISWRIPKRFQ